MALSKDDEVRAGVPSIPGRLYLTALPLLATGVLLLNDHVLKRLVPSVMTGKLSDAAGVFLLPILALAGIELLLAAMHRPWMTTRKRLVIAVAVTGFGFAAVKGVPAVTTAYAYALGCLRWPIEAVASLVDGRHPDAVLPVSVLTDWTDILVLPVLGFTWLCGRRWTAEHSTTRRSA